MSHQDTTETNLANQKKAALNFLSSFPETERIKFTEDGITNPAGYWSAWATVTIAGQDYQEDIGPHVLGGDPLPDPIPNSTPSPVQVTYSDGSSGVVG